MKTPFLSYEPCQSKQQQSLFTAEHRRSKPAARSSCGSSPWRQHIPSELLACRCLPPGARVLASPSADSAPPGVGPARGHPQWRLTPAASGVKWNNPRESQVAGGHTGFLETLETCPSVETWRCHPAWPRMPSSKPSGCHLHSQPAEQKAERYSMAKIHNGPDPTLCK